MDPPDVWLLPWTMVGLHRAHVFPLPLVMVEPWAGDQARRVVQVLEVGVADPQWCY